MMENEASPDIVKVFTAIYRHRYFMLICVALGAAWGVMYYSISPKIFKTEAVILIPETSNHPISIDIRGNVNSLVNVYETRYILKNYWNKEVKGGKDVGLDRDCIRKVKNIEVEDIRGSNVQFNLVVYVKENDTCAKKIVDHLFNYLRENEYVKRKYEEEVRTLDSLLSEISVSIAKSMELRNRANEFIKMGRQIQFNPVEIEMKIIELKEKYHHYTNIKKSMHNYEYIRKPYTSPNPIGPSLLSSIFTTSLISFFIGIIILYIRNMIMKRCQGKVMI